MIGRALDAGTSAAWVTGDEVYGADPACADLERRQTRYVLAVAASHRVATAAGTCPALQLAARLPRRAWQRYSAAYCQPRYRRSARDGVMRPPRRAGARRPGCRPARAAGSAPGRRPRAAPAVAGS